LDAVPAHPDIAGIHSSETLLDPAVFDRKFAKGHLADLGGNPTAIAFAWFCAAEKGVPMQLVLTDELSSHRDARHPDYDNAVSGWATREGQLEIHLLHPHMLEGDSRQRIWTRLVLHELGHFILHYRQLKKHSKGPTPEPPIATAEQEEQAWLFAHVVYGLAVAGLAWEERSGKKIGRAPFLS
jgi:hypothetical protein